MAKKTTIYPVPERFLQGVPAVPLRTDARTAARLVRTGAFTIEGSGDGAVEFDGDVADFYDPPAEQSSESPAAAGEET